jgi:branched-chain amino acid transport system ATP-binding protein
MDALLRIRDLEKSFGGVKALEDVNLSVPRNSIMAVIGPNGSGKTTLLNCINGVYVPEKGEISYRGRAITGRKAHQITRMGIGRTFQIARVFKRVTVLDNVIAPVLNTVRALDELRNDARALLERVGLSHMADSFGSELSGGQQKLIELLRAWIADFELILLDEPFAGVHPDLKRLFYEEIRQLQQNGKTFVLVSHDMQSVYTLSDEIAVLDLGRVIAQGREEDIKSDDRVIEAYLGT